MPQPQPQPQPLPTRDPLVAASVYAEIQQFYARQMHAIDSDDAEAWTNSFAEDGVFESNALPEPGRGRAIIGWGARKGIEERASKGIVRRHVMTMLSAEDRGDGAVFTRSYVLVVETPPGGPSEIYINTTCEDVLIRDGESGAWQVRHRLVTRDDLLAVDSRSG